MVIFFTFRSPGLVKYVISVLVIFVISEIICLILFVLILKNLRRHSAKFSPQTYRLHLTFTLLLGCQLLSPIIYMFVPIFMGILATLFRIQPKKYLVDISLLCIMFYGLSNTALMIGFISPYQKHFLSVFIFPWLKPLLKIVKFKSSSTSTRVHVLSPSTFNPNRGR